MQIPKDATFIREKTKPAHCDNSRYARLTEINRKGRGPHPATRAKNTRVFAVRGLKFSSPKTREFVIRRPSRTAGRATNRGGTYE